jgi:uncharacterized membrane protein
VTEQRVSVLQEEVTNLRLQISEQYETIRALRSDLARASAPLPAPQIHGDVRITIKGDRITTNNSDSEDDDE